MEDEELIRITPEKAVEILRKDGINVNTEEAKIILDFFYIMSHIAVEQYTSNRQCEANIVG